MKETANQQDTLAAELEKRAAEIKKGGAPKYHEKTPPKGNCLFASG